MYTSSLDNVHVGGPLFYHAFLRFRGNPFMALGCFMNAML